MKKITITILLAIILIFTNGCYFVFYGQHKAAQKLENKETLNKYEVFSTYTMHLAICTIGWIYSPEGTMEYIRMSFKRNRNKSFYIQDDFFLTSPVVQKALVDLENEKRIAFRDNCYSLHNPNHRVALAANPGYLNKIDSIVTFRVPVHYPYCLNTKIYITKNIYILMNESLFNYLEKINILHPYTITYYTIV